MAYKMNEEQLKEKVKYNTTWMKENRERLAIVLPKGTKERIQEVLMGKESMNKFIEKLINREIEERERLKKEDELKRYSYKEPEKPKTKETRQQEPPNDPIDNDMLKLANLGVKKGFSDDFMDIPDGIEDYVENEPTYEDIDPTAPRPDEY